jgi:queuosine precursor transporter
MIGPASLIAFLLTIPLANWLIGNVGTVCVPSGPCLIPVLPGVLAPSGVLVIGAALVLRDAVHRYMGPHAALAAICAGAALSAAIAPAALVMASTLAFLLGELADWAVYRPLHRRRLALAVMLSGAAGAAVDSAIFLVVAFGSLDYVSGQIAGKLMASALAAVFILAARPARAA